MRHYGSRSKCECKKLKYIWEELAIIKVRDLGRVGNNKSAREGGTPAENSGFLTVLSVCVTNFKSDQSLECIIVV